MPIILKNQPAPLGLNLPDPAKKMERITEIMQKFPECCLEDTLGLPLVHPKNAVRFEWLVYDFLPDVPSICCR